MAYFKLNSGFVQLDSWIISLLSDRDRNRTQFRGTKLDLPSKITWNGIQRLQWHQVLESIAGTCMTDRMCHSNRLILYLRSNDLTSIMYLLSPLSIWYNHYKPNIFKQSASNNADFFCSQTIFSPTKLPRVLCKSPDY